MKLAIFGATGPLGLRLTRQALDAQHETIVLARTPEKLPEEIRNNPNLTVVQGDVMSEADCEKVLAGADATIVTLGGPGNTCSEGQKRVDEAINKVNPDMRVVLVTSLGCNESYAKSNWMTKIVVNLFISAAISDKNIQEDELRKSVKNWTIVRPGGLRDGDGTGAYAAGEDVAGGMIDRADVARFILGECLTGDKWLKKAPAVVGA